MSMVNVKNLNYNIELDDDLFIERFEDGRCVDALHIERSMLTDWQQAEVDALEADVEAIIERCEGLFKRLQK